MRGLRFSGLLAALLLALGLAFAPPAWAECKAGAPKSSAAEARYDNSRQAALLQQQISVLAPQKKGVTDIYALGIAGWTTDVFRNELAGALKITSKALPLNGGTVRLINSRETADTIPLASRKNFAAAVRGIARVMDKEEDVLFLFMTSHGEKRSFGLQLPSTIVRLKPSEVAAVLDREGIKNRVVIVSACYSGIFVKPLADENTIVLTAADQKSTSFGCAEGREWTYFGDALFHHSLKPETDFRDAFAKARGLIAEWEKRDRFTPSNPQGHFGEALMRKLAPLIQERERTNNKNRALDNARQGWSDNQDDQKSACSIGRGQGGPCPTDAAREAAPDVPFAVMPLHPGPNAFQDDDCGLGDPVASSSPPFLPCGTAG